MDTTGSYVRVHFMDFASAFSSVQPRVLLQRLLDLNVNQSIIFRLREFLSGRTQRVSLDGFVSEEFVLQTGVPLGCSSCFVFVCLFVVFVFVCFITVRRRNVCRPIAIQTLIKHSTDTALICRLKDETTLSDYLH